MITVEINPAFDISSELLKKAARAALDEMGVPDADLSVVAGDDDRIQSLNRDFLGRDAPTDVISFPADEIDPETNRKYLGDVILAYPFAESQARERGHSVESELQLLVIHGVLHLLGFDHESKLDRVRMWAVQGRILETLGLSPDIVHAED
jgi:probable rRNA maturation factor